MMKQAKGKFSISVATKKTRMPFFTYLLIALVLIGFFAVVYYINLPIPGQVPTAASQVQFERATVSTLFDEAAAPDTWTEGLRLGQQAIEVTVASGTYKNQKFQVVNYMGAYGNVDVKQGTKIIVRMDQNDQGQPFIASIVNYDRTLVIVGLLVLFSLSLVFLGGKKGVAALAGLVFTVLSIWYFLIPMIQRGVAAIPATIVLVVITTVISLVALGGLSKKTFSAIAGCIIGVTLAGVVAMIAGMLTPLDGFNMPEAEELVLRAYDSSLKIRGLLVSGILIAALGAVMDVAMSISSAIHELSQHNPKLKATSLFQSGINIGRDAMGTMANTLILAFAGAALNTLVLFRIFDYPYLQIFNSDLMVIEIVQGLAGSIGIIMTVPVVAAIASMLYGHKQARG